MNLDTRLLFVAQIVIRDRSDQSSTITEQYFTYVVLLLWWRVRQQAVTTAACKITKICVVTTTFSLGKVSKNRSKLKSKFILRRISCHTFSFSWQVWKEFKEKNGSENTLPKTEHAKASDWLHFYVLNRTKSSEKKTRKRPKACNDDLSTNGYCYVFWVSTFRLACCQNSVPVKTIIETKQ